MRVAVHFPADHPLSPGEASVAAYRLGRIEDGVHNAPLGYDPIPLDQYLANVVKAAKAEYPDADVVIERLVEDGGPEQGKWIPAEEFDAGKHTPVGAGQHVEREVSASAHPRRRGKGDE